MQRIRKGKRAGIPFRPVVSSSELSKQIEQFCSQARMRLAGMHGRLQAQQRELLARLPQKHLQEAKTNPYDTHPPLRYRIAATESLPALSVQEDTRPATALLDQLQNLERQFIEDRVPNIKPGTLQYISWDEVTRRVRIPSWQRAVAAHAAVLKGVTAESIPDQIPTFPEIGSRIPDPKGMLLTPKQRTHRAGQVFAAALVLALIENRWELYAQPGIFQLRRGTDELDPFLVVQELLAGKRSSDDWVRQCKTLGISQLSLSATEDNADARPLDRFQQRTLFDA